MLNTSIHGDVTNPETKDLHALWAVCSDLAKEKLDLDMPIFVDKGWAEVIAWCRESMGYPAPNFKNKRRHHAYVRNLRFFEWYAQRLQHYRKLHNCERRRSVKHIAKEVMDEFLPWLMKQ